MTYDSQDFEAPLLPSEDLIMSMSPGDYVVIGGLKMEMGVVKEAPECMIGQVFLSASADNQDCREKHVW